MIRNSYFNRGKPLRKEAHRGEKPRQLRARMALEEKRAKLEITVSRLGKVPFHLLSNEEKGELSAAQAWLRKNPPARI